jgi:hypothetical protein
MSSESKKIGKGDHMAGNKKQPIKGEGNRG